MTDEQSEKLFAWATNFGEMFDFVKDQSGCIRMLVQTKQPHTQRACQRSLRTNLLNYGVSLPAKQEGWLNTFDENEYDRMKDIVARGLAPPDTIDNVTKSPLTLRLHLSVMLARSSLYLYL